MKSDTFNGIFKLGAGLKKKKKGKKKVGKIWQLRWTWLARSFTHYLTEMVIASSGCEINASATILRHWVLFQIESRMSSTDSHVQYLMLPSHIFLGLPVFSSLLLLLLVYMQGSILRRIIAHFCALHQLLGDGVVSGNPYHNSFLFSILCWTGCCGPIHVFDSLSHTFTCLRSSRFAEGTQFQMLVSTLRIQLS